MVVLICLGSVVSEQRPFPGTFWSCVAWVQFASWNRLLERWPCLNSFPMSSNIGQVTKGQVSFTGLVNIQSPTAPVLKFFWKADLRKQHYFLHNSGAQPMSLMENSAPGLSTKENARRNTQGLGLLSHSPYPLSLEHIPILEHLSAEGAIICQLEAALRSVSWKSSLLDTWCQRTIYKLFRPKRLHHFGGEVVEVGMVSLTGEPAWIWRLGAHADSKRPSRPIVGSTFPATCSQLRLPQEPSILDGKSAQPQGVTPGQVTIAWGQESAFFLSFLFVFFIL